MYQFLVPETHMKYCSPTAAMLQEGSSFSVMSYGPFQTDFAVYPQP